LNIALHKFRQMDRFVTLNQQSASRSFSAIRNVADRGTLEAAESRLRLQTMVRLRWFAVLGQFLAVIVIFFGFGFQLPMGWCLLFISVSAWLNVFLRVRYPARHRLGTTFATVLLSYDVLQLAALLYLTGGIENPFTVLILAPVTVSAANLPPRNTIFLGILALSAAAFILVQHLQLPWPAGETLVLPRLYKFGILAAVAACMTFIALYSWRLSKEARQMSAALAATELVLAREQKLHAMDGLAAAAAHELGTPLATIVLVAKEMERAFPAGDTMIRADALAEDLALLRSQALRCKEIMQKLTSRPTERDPLHASLTITQLIEEAVAPHRAYGIQIAVDANPVIPLQVPAVIAAGTTGRASNVVGEPVGERRPGLIYGVGNLIENAVEFAKARVDVTARWDDDTITLIIQDDGPGFKPDVMDALGDPYVTTRPASAQSTVTGDSTGLGLGFFIAKTLLERSGASLALANRSAPEQGAIVRVTWPRRLFEGTPSEWPAEAGRGLLSERAEA
jgi:two-component system, sensor histidine kinase RegB